MEKRRMVEKRSFSVADWGLGVESLAKLPEITCCARGSGIVLAEPREAAGRRIGAIR
jgi:hypothetical protein